MSKVLKIFYFFRHRDDEIEDEVETVIPGFRGNMTALDDTIDEPWWLDSCLFALLTLMFCSCPLRVFYRSKAQKFNFILKKSFFVQDPSVVLPPTSPTSEEQQNNEGEEHVPLIPTGAEAQPPQQVILNYRHPHGHAQSESQ